MMYNNISSQELSLKITSANEKEINVLSKIEYLKKHKDTTSLNSEIIRISNYLKKIGYFTNTVNEIKKENKKHTVFYSLNKKIENAIIRVNSESKVYLENFKIKNNTISTPISDLQSTLYNI